MHITPKRPRILLLFFGILFVSAVIATWYLRYGSSGLVKKTYCSDVCPDNTRTFDVYKNIRDQAACDKIHGQTIKDAAWGGYIGCRPKPNGAPSVIRS